MKCITLANVSPWANGTANPFFPFGGCGCGPGGDGGTGPFPHGLPGAAFGCICEMHSQVPVAMHPSHKVAGRQNPPPLIAHL